MSDQNDNTVFGGTNDLPGGDTAAVGYGGSSTGAAGTTGDFGSTGGSDSSGAGSTAQTAKAEAGEVKDTAVDAAKNVAHTAADEAKNVAHEARANASDLYHQARTQLGDQAGKQQQRLASGLSSVAEELGGMARGSDSSGVAADLVQRASSRVDSAASWLSSRDPAGVLADVKAFARRRPGIFIAGAVVAGVVAGRLTRALAAGAPDSTGPATTPTTGTGTGAQSPVADAGFVAPATVIGSAPVTTEVYAADTADTVDPLDSPVYTEAASRYTDDREEGIDERRDSF